MPPNSVCGTQKKHRECNRHVMSRVMRIDHPIKYGLLSRTIVSIYKLDASAMGSTRYRNLIGSHIEPECVA